MDDAFKSAMRRTLDAVRAGNLTEATRLAQEGLGRAPQGAPAPAAPKADTTEPGALHGLFDRLRDGLSGIADCAGAARPLGGGVDLPAGAQWLARHARGPEGGRDYRLFLPSRGAAAATGLLLMLHGCKQDPEDFARGTGMLAVAEAAGLIVAFPAQPRIANMSGCWNWFEPGHQGAAAGEPAILAGLVRDLMAEFAIAPDRVFAAGLSAGGAMVAVLADAAPGLFAAIGIHSGLAAGAAHDVASAFAAMEGRGGPGRPALRPGGPRLIVFHGEADATVAPGNADRIVGAAPGERQTGHSPGGRSWSRRILRGPDGRVRAEDWRVAGSGHAWSGGSPTGSYTDPAGPDASQEMVRFFLEG